MTQRTSTARAAVSLEKQARIQRAISILWASERPFTYANIAELTRAPHKSPVSKSTVCNCLATFQGNDTAIARTSGSGGGIASYIFNWTGRPMADALRPTLADALDVAYGPDGVPAQMHPALNSAMRALFLLPEQAPVKAILARAAEVSVADLRDLPTAVATKVLSRPCPEGRKPQKKLAANYKSVVRAALLAAAKAGAVPLVFPTIFPEDPWERSIELMLGRREGKFTRTQLAARCHWRTLARLARLHYPHATPASLTEQELDDLIRKARQAGKYYILGFIKWMFRKLGKEHGEGPYAAMMRDPNTTWSRQGSASTGYLLGPGGDAVSDGDVDRFVDLLKSNGFGPEWEEFIRWYHQYSTLPFDEIERRYAEFPPRHENRHLAQTTWRQRLLTVRAWLYQALSTTGVSADELSPEHVFGQYFREILGAVKGWWAERAQRGEVSAETSDGMTGIVQSAGMIARALYDRRKHRRRRSLIRPGMTTAEVNDQEETSAKTGIEELLWEGYTLMRVNLKRFEALRPNTPGGYRFTTEKDVRRIVENTPYTYWIALLDEMHKEIRRLDERGRSDYFRTHTLVRDAYVHGILLSTAMRRSEMCHVRLDIQYGPQDRAARRMSLRAVDRKNEKPHRVAIRERYVPSWLEERYLQKTRPFFMRDRHLAMGNPSLVQAHQHLFVDTSGCAFGDSTEAADGSGRDAYRLDVRKGAFGNVWKGRAEITAARLGLYIPEVEAEGSMHAVRNAMAAAIARTMGFEAAANLLGDAPSSVMDTYGFLDGQAIDSTALPGVMKTFSDLQRLHQVKPQVLQSGINPVGDAPASPGVTGLVQSALAAQLQSLTKALVEGTLSPEEFRCRAARVEEAMVA